MRKSGTVWNQGRMTTIPHAADADSPEAFPIYATCRHAGAERRSFATFMTTFM
jgi:hypothetical protein